MDKMYYGMAALEVADGNIDAALMIKAMALSGGDEKLGRATYIELRAKEIETEHRKARVVSAVNTTAAVTGDVTKAAVNAAAGAIKSGAVSRAGAQIFKAILWIAVIMVGVIALILIIESNSRSTSTSTEQRPAQIQAPGMRAMTYNDLSQYEVERIESSCQSYENNGDISGWNSCKTRLFNQAVYGKTVPAR